MLENRLSDGAHYQFRDLASGEGDNDAMLNVLINFWSAARTTFPDAWDKPPRQSRLMHAVGIVSLGFLMDAVFDRYSRSHIPTEQDCAADLSALADVFRWTTGYWEFGPASRRKWNELQNVSRDTQLLTSYPPVPLQVAGVVCAHGLRR